MKRLTAVGIGVVALAAFAGIARAADAPMKQEGRIWVYQPLTLAFSPQWSFTMMPGIRTEFWRTRESETGVHFHEYFVGPNFTHKMGDLTFKASLWYYFMGYPQRGRVIGENCSGGQISKGGVLSPVCASGYNLSHNLEIIPIVEYRTGPWTINNRIILHNTIYADVYGTDEQRLGWGTVLREMLTVRYAVTDKLGLLLADEPFFGIIEDGDTSSLANGAGYHPLGFWKSGLRLNRTYVGFDYKVTPAFSITPQYIAEIMLNRLETGDVTDLSHTLMLSVGYVAKLF
jgi:hypothetical protein